MMKPNIIERRIKARREEPNHGKAGVTDGEHVPRGGTTYREEYQPDHGPDLDERLDVTESGDEF
jgi:hypothetical protein